MYLKALTNMSSSYNLSNYEDVHQGFDWKQTEQQFTWYETGRVNIAYEAVDRHAESFRANKVALHYFNQSRKETYTFKDLKKHSNRAGNVLKDIGHVEKGDRVFIFMPRSPELYFCLLGTIKLGAIVGPMFEAFMEDALKDRLDDSGAKVLITTEELLTRIPISVLPALETIFVIGDSVRESGKIKDFRQYYQKAAEELDIEWVDRQDGLILHYTSGSTGKPKGVLHVHNAMIQHYQTAKWVLDLKEDDVYWCTADPGWVTGTSYGVFGPWLCGATNVVAGGRFHPDTWYKVIELFRVSVWYSAPTSFRMLMAAKDEISKKYRLTSLRHILSVGEPLNPEVIRFGLSVYGLRIHDTWWMTETGAQLICNFPCMDIKLGSMGKPIPGVTAVIIDDNGNILPANQMGNLAIKKGWPSMMKSIWNNEKKFNSYFQQDDWYVSGDCAYIDEDGYFWFQGRIDDVIMTAGERVGPFEVESKLIEFPAVAEAGVIGKPDPLRGEIIKAFVSLVDGHLPSEALKEEIRLFVKTGLSAHAAPREIEFCDKIPKTRSGKIMRRVLKAWELGLPTGDLSTMEE